MQTPHHTLLALLSDIFLNFSLLSGGGGQLLLYGGYSDILIAEVYALRLQTPPNRVGLMVTILSPLQRL